MTLRRVRTPKAPAAIGPYSQAVVAGNLVFVSGQIPLDPESGEIVGRTAVEQAERVLANLAAILEAAGASFADVVRTTVYLADLEDFSAVNEVYAKAFGENRPARATVQAMRLPKDARVEIDAVAVLPTA